MSNSNIKIGIIGGTGLGDKLGLETGQTVNPDTPFGKPSSPIIHTTWEGVDIYLLQRHGIGHIHNPSAVPYRANIFALKQLGVTHILASGATGSLREEYRPGDLVIVDQIIDKTYKRTNTFFERAAVHVEFADPFCSTMRNWLLNATKYLPSNQALENNDAPKPQNITVHAKGTYVVMEGPAFSTRAESHMHRAWGGDLIGMTAMPEAKLAREAEIAYAMIAMPTDYDCWRPHEVSSKQALLEEIIGNLNRATTNNIALIKAALRDLTILESEPCPAHAALAMGIWSHKDKIPADEINKLQVLWGKYFK
ncbi:S-methyl-5'-thioadenosine phosphorylase [Poriferisphaera corsica]|uniref:Purine nucleoside phosphorylase n=1 Tax=Poriferisphaera corsica TaxID=2528020 RepID=A0A517YQW5_9BACT|nr:S-methyl-5'-thioadenosine phosphorylase [Poriferisphaera corsica]QDU32581.1 S-methyl-5'-thioadenosine phosphorylase [Poriferisphaera corsica]